MTMVGETAWDRWDRWDAKVRAEAFAQGIERGAVFEGFPLGLPG